MKKNLSEIQKTFASVILEGSLPVEWESLVCEKPPISTRRRTEIYQQAYQIRLLESLRDDFPKVEELIGDDEFQKLALEFIKKHPSKYVNLGEYSQNFPLFLKEKSLELFELASVEWIFILSSHAAFYNYDRALSVREIESGVPFRLRRNPSFQFFLGAQKNTITFRSHGQVIIKEVDSMTLNILNMINDVISVEEFTEKIENLSIQAEEFQKMMSLWVKDETIFCERMKHDSGI